MIARVCRASFLKSSVQDRKVLRSGVGRSISVSRAGPHALQPVRKLECSGYRDCTCFVPVLSDLQMSVEVICTWKPKVCKIIALDP